MQTDDLAADFQLVGVREAARALGLNASTVSKQVRKGIIPNHGTDTAPLINVAEAKVKRAERLNPLKARNRGGAMGYEQTLLENERASGTAAIDAPAQTTAPAKPTVAA